MTRISPEKPEAEDKRPAPFERFVREEDGVITIFTIFMLFMVLMVCGIAVDLMRNEMERIKVQNTLDRAILAAADLQQTLDPNVVVTDYFEKAGIAEYLGDITVTPGDNLPTNYFRTVEASARARTPSPYMAMTGVNDLPLFVAGTAEEVVSNLEISLVLDVSGSMGRNSRLVNLKVAAKDFVDQIANNSQDGRMAISIVPYATQVSIPDAMADRLTLEGTNPHSNCLNFAASDFLTPAMRVPSAAAGAPPVVAYERTMHFDPWTYRSSLDDGDGRLSTPHELVKSPVCEADANREILPLQKDRDVLKNYIEALDAAGNTSIDVGMKWGLAMLDSSMSPMVEGLISDGTVSAQFSGRPADYNSDENLKVIVLMTDGENTAQYYIEDGYREGQTVLWWNADASVYSVYDDITEEFYYSRAVDTDGDADVDGDDERWGVSPYGCLNPTNSSDSSDWDCSAGTPAGGAYNISFPDLWAHTPILENFYTNFYPWMNYSTAANRWYYNAFDNVSSGTKNTRTENICDEAKDEGVIVFTIGFEAPENGQAVLRNCASSVSHYFDVDGLEIADAFNAIAHEITQLRLTH
ncbi:TadE/TadG family type IV pilus assembly protein [uncultured Roseobacter sp.]|uniref:TadE/TadG family type IV pilus assembly protein n=1 Tax=uncultured Roseobacter sp. TaxID=114847 RepID=UPI0026223DE8|nr:TadE/TadG family type IV pilus assembly protein [uncultured Roseobacter sp.]